MVPVGVELVERTKFIRADATGFLAEIGPIHV
jgi:hypothetical protein